MFDEFITYHKQAAMQILSIVSTLYQLFVIGEDTNFPNQSSIVLHNEGSIILGLDYIENGLGEFHMWENCP